MKKLLAAWPLLLLSACAPHPGAGKWRAANHNEAGISDLVLAYDGRALFATARPKASWHCFWSAKSATTVLLDCTPSNEPSRKSRWSFTVEKDGTGRLERDGKEVARFRRIEGNPEIPRESPG